MASVSEQIQAYRALKAQQEPVSSASSADGSTIVLERQHVPTKDYFRLLMQRWHNNHMKSKS